MLHQVLAAFEHANGPLSLDELSRELGIERGTLEAMLDFWVRKGRLRAAGGGCGAVGPGCTCSSHPDGCAFARPGPRTITLKQG
ncbi:MAG: FeoC-like transcriptional regulator [Oscillochloridaceae bacterium umkhey_bin13]